MEAMDSFCFPKNTKNPNPSPIGKKFGFCCCGAPPGTRTLGPLIKRNQRATIVNFQNCVNSLFLSFRRKFAFLHLLHSLHLLSPLASVIQPFRCAKSVQKCAEPKSALKNRTCFLCNGVKMSRFHPANDAPDITSLYHTSNVHQQLRFMAGIWTIEQTPPYYIAGTLWKHGVPAPFVLSRIQRINKSFKIFMQFITR